MLNILYVGSEDLTAVVMNIAIFWDIEPCSLYATYVSEESITSVLRVENSIA
jgi:hypothetical protein